MLVLVFLGISSLAASGLEAQYFDESNPIIKDNRDFQLVDTENDYDKDYKVAFKVGTLILYPTNPHNLPEIDDLELTRSNEKNKNKYTLESTKKIGNKKKFDAELVVKITCCGSNIGDFLLEEVEDDLLDDCECSNHFPITIEFFMVIKHIIKASDAAGVGFQFSFNKSPGQFSLEYEDDDDDKEYKIPVNGSTSPSLFLSPAFTEGSGLSFINGDSVGPPATAWLSVTQTPEEETISFSQALNNNKVKVGEVEVVLEDHNDVSKYGVSVTFTDYYNPSSNNFVFKHANPAVNATIPYTLLYETKSSYREVIVPKVPIIWDELAGTTDSIKNKWNLYITNINSTDIQMKQAGTYKTIVKVEIAPLDSNVQLR